MCQFEADEIMLILETVPLVARQRLLTGVRHVWTADEVCRAMETMPMYVRRVMTKFPGRRSMIDLEKLVVAINNGTFPPPSSV